MSLTPTQGQSIIVELPEDAARERDKYPRETGAELAGWIMGKVNVWEDARNRGYQRLWGEYWRMWRGMWSEQDKNRMSERSRLIAPALSQAIDMTVSEIEEAIFSRPDWFDAGSPGQKLADEVTDLLVKDQLITDLDKVNARDQIMEAIQNGCIFGTMIAKINTYVGNDLKPTRDDKTFELKAASRRRVFVSVQSIRADEFIPDPVGKTIQEMLGCAHRVQRTMHHCLEQIEKGVYREGARRELTATRRIKNSDVDWEDPQSINSTYESEQVDIVEYHGKVPAKYILQMSKTDNVADDLLLADFKDIEKKNGSGPLVEAIVTIGNGSVVLRAMVNPFAMKDRSIVAAQLEPVPGRFWGRGVAEKGYNPQKALDAELRARIDALGYISAPMMGVDSGRIPRGFKFEVRPGKVWTTQGPPNEVLQQVGLNSNQYGTLTFEQTQEMERMVQMGTGAFDTATALKAQSQSGANGASSNSALMGAFVKRSKRSIASISRNFLMPIVQKCLWRYMQFDPARYPKDFDISLKTTMGIVAREVEASQMTQLMGMMPQEFHQVQLVLARGIIESTSLSNKDGILKIIDGILNPDPQQQQAQQQKQQQAEQLQEELIHAELQGKMLGNQKTIAEIHDIQGKTAMHAHNASATNARIQIEQQQVQAEIAQTQNAAVQNHISMMRLRPEMMKAEAAMIAARKKPAGSSGS